MTGRWRIACINWGHPTAPHAVSYYWDGTMRAERYWATWADAIAHVMPDGRSAA